MAPEIGFIIPYFGQWPPWISYYLKSCEANPYFHWFIITDLGKPVNNLHNVHFIQTSLNELKDRISGQLQINPAIIHPYKLVDFKPAFGIIFEDLLREIPFWGYTDIDLIYGNLSHFITKDILKSHDIISPHTDFVPGHFSVFRNTAYINRIFMSCHNWREIFESPRCFCFDEHLYVKGLELNDLNIKNYITWKIRKHQLLKRIRSLVILKSFKRNKLRNISQSFTEAKDFNDAIELESKLSHVQLYSKTMYSDDAMQFKPRKALRQTVWKNGSLFLNEKEILYYHFQMAKYHKNFSVISDPGGHIKFRI